MQHLTTETLGPLSHYAIKSDTEAFGHFRSKCLIRQFLIILSDIFSYMMQNMPSLKLHHLKYLWINKQKQQKVSQKVAKSLKTTNWNGRGKYFRRQKKKRCRWNKSLNTAPQREH